MRFLLNPFFLCYSALKYDDLSSDRPMKQKWKTGQRKVWYLYI